MKFGLYMVAMSVMVCDGRSRVGSRSVSRGASRNIGAASRRMLAGRSSKSRGRSRGGSRSKSGDPVLVEMRDVDWRVCWIGILFGLCFLYVIR